MKLIVCALMLLLSANTADAGLLGMGGEPPAPPLDPSKQIVIASDKPFQVPPDLKTCLVFDGREFLKKIEANAKKKECDVIRLRAGTDIDPGKPFWIQFEKPVVVDTPLIVINDTGRPVEFRSPQNRGCALVIRGTPTVVQGFSFLGAVCYDRPPAPPEEE